MFPVSPRGVGRDDADIIEGAREIVQDQPPGCYHVDAQGAHMPVRGCIW